MNRSFLYIMLGIALMMLSYETRAFSVDSLQSPKVWIETQIENAQSLQVNSKESLQAIAVFKKTLDFAKTQNLAEEFPELSIGYGTALYRTGDFENSYRILSHILPHIDDADLKNKAKVNQILGMNLVFQDNFSEGYKFQMEALKYYSDIKDSVALMNMYYDIGANFGAQEHFELGLKNYEKGMAIAKSRNDSKMVILGTTAIGGAYAAMEKYDKALAYSDESIKLAESLNDLEELGWASINRGHLLGKIEKYDAAEKFLKRAYQISFKIENQLLTGYALEQFSEIYIKQKKLDKAIKVLGESYEIYQSSGQHYSIKSVFKKYADIYAEKRDFEKFKYYTNEYIALKDSIYSKEMLESMADLKQDYEIHTLERENQIALLKKDQELKNANAKVTWAIFFGAAGILILLLTLMYNRNKSATEKNDILTAKNAEIVRQNEFLANSNRDLEKFAYIISHDLKEPLRNINGFTKLLERKLRKYGDDQDVKEYASFIVNGTKQMEELLSGLLDYSKVSVNKQQKEIIDVNVRVQDVVSSLNIQMKEKNCKIILQDLPKVWYRKAHLTQIFQNLIANAIKFGKDEGNTITVGCEELETEYKFFIKDRGIGIDPSFQENIFVVFQRLHSRGEYSGSGIGLATCKKIVDDHGGRIWVNSCTSQGSCFYFTIPKVELKENHKEANALEAKEPVLI